MNSVEEKLAQSVLFVCAKFGGDGFGVDRLNMTLWHTDTCGFLENGREVSGARFTKAPQGPVVENLNEVLGHLVSSGKLVVSQVQVGDHSATNFEVGDDLDGDAEFDLLSERDRNLLARYGEMAKQETVAEARSWSHDMVWSVATLGEELPVAAAVVMRATLTPAA